MTSPKTDRPAPFANRIVGYGVKAADQFVFNPRNPRSHPQRQRDAVRQSLDRVGWVGVVLENVRTGYTIDGHERIWQALDTNSDVPYVQVDLSEEEEALVLATFDPLTYMADTDADMLASLLNQVEAAMPDMSGLLEAVAETMKVPIGAGDTPDDPGAQMDRAEELRETWGVERGQIWQVGRHRITCDDAIKTEANQKWALFTDPPYGINRDPSWLDDVGTHRQALSSRDILMNDDNSLDLTFLWKFSRRMVWGFPYLYDEKATGWIVWDKQPGVASRGIVTPIEIASTTMRKGFDIVRVMWGGYYRAAGEKRAAHPTQKPISVIMPFMQAWTKLGEIIYDPFLGSGTTIVAAEQLGRICYGMDIEPKYVAVTLQRLADMGLTPQLVNS